jgi:integrase
MGLYRRSNSSVWWMSFTHNGQQYRRSTETEDKKLAQRIFDKLRGEIAEGNWFEKLPGESYKFKDLMDKYMKEHSALYKAKTSHIRDKSIIAHLNLKFGEMFLTEITTAMISEYKTQRKIDGASARTINYELTLMSHAYNLAIKEWEWVKDNPVKRVKKEKLNNTIERWLTQDEEERLMKASPAWIREIIVFAIHTGLRLTELLDLKWYQIDLDRGTLTIYEQKNKGVDTLPLSETVRILLKEKSRMSPTQDDYVFPGKLNERRDTRSLQKSFNTSLKRVGIKNFRFHDLRHTFATRLVQRGVGIYEVQKLGRWKNTSMVMRYAHHYPESLRSSIEVMDNNNRKPIITFLSQSQKKVVTRSHLRLVSS